MDTVRVIATIQSMTIAQQSRHRRSSAGRELLLPPGHGRGARPHPPSPPQPVLESLCGERHRPRRRRAVAGRRGCRYRRAHNPRSPRSRISSAGCSLTRERVVALGGDHSISYPLVRAHARVHSGLTILHLDAHPDLYDELDGSRVSHGCPFARVMEEGLAARMVSLGIRTANPHQREQAERFGVETFGPTDDLTTVLASLAPPLYLSLDLDVLDPAFRPGHLTLRTRRALDPRRSSRSSTPCRVRSPAPTSSSSTRSATSTA